MTQNVDNLIAAAKAAVSHWNEFGPGHGYDQAMDQLERALSSLPAVPDVLKPATVEPAPRGENNKLLTLYEVVSLEYDNNASFGVYSTKELADAACDYYSEVRERFGVEIDGEVWLLDEKVYDLDGRKEREREEKKRALIASLTEEQRALLGV